MKTLEEVLLKIKFISKKKRAFLVFFVHGLMGISGKRNSRNISRYISMCEHTFGRQMEKEVNFIEINKELINTIKQPEEIWVGVHDPSFIEKSGKKTYGLGRYWNGSAGRAEKGLEISVIAAVKVSGPGREGYAIYAEQTPPPPVSKNKEEREETKIDSYVSHLKKAAPTLLEMGITHLVTDAGLSNKKYVSGAAAVGLKVVSKLRKDARLTRHYTGPQKARGRKRKFDGRVTPEDFDQLPPEVTKKDGNEKIELRSMILYSVSLQQLIKVVKVIVYKDQQKCREFLLFSTDLNLSTDNIHEFYSARFQIEFVFRDGKQNTGLGDCQSRNKQRLHYHFNASLLAVNVAKIQHAKLQKNRTTLEPFSMASWSRKYNVEIVINQFISMFGFNQTLIKSHPNYESFLSFGRITH